MCIAVDIPQKKGIFTYKDHLKSTNSLKMKLNSYHLIGFLVLITCFFSYSSLNAQGCVAIRGNSSCSNMGSTLNLAKGDFDVQFGYRYFKSDKHFRGDVEEKHRQEEGTEVVNESTFLDFSITYGISDRIFINAIIPTVYHKRSSMYEHGGNPPSGLGDRHETSSRGLADIRLGIGYWLFNPDSSRFNYSIGIGVKLPTGKYNYEDTFYNQGSNKDENIEKVVDQSIQPGDGGTALTIDVRGFHPISHSFGISSNLFYLFNFQETNGVLTRNGRSEFSCPDQFAATIGGFYNTMKGFNFYLGSRAEGVPANDLIGSSSGYRRPGYAISAEPGVGYSKNNLSVSATLPIALYRNRTRSFEDKVRTAQTGVYRHGDAAFADYLINVIVAYRFSSKNNFKGIN